MKIRTDISSIEKSIIDYKVNQLIYSTLIIPKQSVYKKTERLIGKEGTAKLEEARDRT